MNIPRHMRSYASYWLYQAKRSYRKGLRGIADGDTDVSWLHTTFPSPAGRVFAALALRRLWDAATPKQRAALRCQWLAERDEHAHGVRRDELARFGMASPTAFNNLLAQVRQKLDDLC